MKERKPWAEILSTVVAVALAVAGVLVGAGVIVLTLVTRPAAVPLVAGLGVLAAGGIVAVRDRRSPWARSLEGRPVPRARTLLRAGLALTGLGAVLLVVQMVLN